MTIAHWPRRSKGCPRNSRLVLTYERDNAPAKMRRLVEKIGVVVSCMRPFENQVPLYVELFARCA